MQEPKTIAPKQTFECIRVEEPRAVVVDFYLRGNRGGSSALNNDLFCRSGGSLSTVWPSVCRGSKVAMRWAATVFHLNGYIAGSDAGGMRGSACF
jgi:hypothetical protein